MVDICFRLPCTGMHILDGIKVSLTENDDIELLQSYAGMMKAMRQQWPKQLSLIDAGMQTVCNQISQLENILVDTLWGENASLRFDELAAERDLILQRVDDVVEHMNLCDNEEQEHAFQLVDMHLAGGVNQLLMYIAGMGGTGKSYVVKAILRLFESLDYRNEILVTALTGAAALLIGGHTIHLLTMLPDMNCKNFELLQEL